MSVVTQKQEVIHRVHEPINGVVVILLCTLYYYICKMALRYRYDFSKWIFTLMFLLFTQRIFSQYNYNCCVILMFKSIAF